jgi:hypothetical protein
VREAPSRPFGHSDLIERRTLVEGLIDSVRSYSDQLTAQVVGAPPIIVALDEVGLRGDIKTVVSNKVTGRLQQSNETRLRRSATSHRRLPG